MERRVAAETKQFGDILRLDSTDTYADLASKTLKLFSKLPDKFEASFYFKVPPATPPPHLRDTRPSSRPLCISAAGVRPAPPAVASPLHARSREMSSSFEVPLAI